MISSASDTTLNWDDCSVATDYRIQLSDSEDFSGTIYSYDLTESEYTLGSNSESYGNNSEYWWRLQWSGKDYDESEWSDGTSFETDFLYNITYDGNGAESGSTPEDMTDYHSTDSVTILGNTDSLTLSGYEFKGWATSDDSDTVEYEEGDTLALSSDLVLYAVWKKIITITYSANGGSGSMDSATVTEGDAVVLSECAYTQSDFFFLGWSTGTYGLSEYTGGEEITAGNSDMTLYAIWIEEWQYSGSFEYKLDVDEKNSLKLIGINCTDTAANLTIPSTIVGLPVTAISNEASSYPYSFSFCYANNITIPDSINRIEGNAFQKNDYIKNLILGDAEGNEALLIGNEAFSGCKNLETVEGTAFSIGSRAFYDCNNLTTVELDSPTIGNSAFYDCNALATLELTETSIGEEAFFNCDGLTELNLTVTTLSLKATTIGASAYEGCTALTTVTLEATTIGDKAFYECTSLSSVTLGASCETIGSGAFQMIKDITLKLEGSAPPETGGTLFSTPREAYFYTIEVPSSSLTNYKTSAFWSEYNSYISGY